MVQTADPMPSARTSKQSKHWDLGSNRNTHLLDIQLPRHRHAVLLISEKLPCYRHGQRLCTNTHARLNTPPAVSVSGRFTSGAKPLQMSRNSRINSPARRRISTAHRGGSRGQEIRPNNPGISPLSPTQTAFELSFELHPHSDPQSRTSALGPPPHLAARADLCTARVESIRLQLGVLGNVLIQ